MRSHAPTQAARAPGHYVFVYDGDCGFCTRMARSVAARARSELQLMPFTEIPPGELLTRLSPQEIRASSHLITPGGREFHGGHSVTRVLRLLPGGWFVAPLDLPGLALLRELGYAGVARNRPLLSRIYR